MHCQWVVFGLGSGTMIQIYGDWLKDKLLELLPYCPSQSTLGSSFPMDRQWHQYLRIPIIAAADTAPPPWCQLGTLPLDSLPLDEHVDWQALKLISAGCQISYQFHFTGCQIFDQFHFEAHLLFGSESSPQYDFFYSIGH